MLLEVQLMGIIVIAVGFGLLIGKSWAEDIAEERMRKLKEEVNWYRKESLFEWPGHTDEAIRDADLNERW